MSASATIRMLSASDLAILRSTAADVFDDPVDARLAEEFLADPRHHMAAAVVDGRIVGMASAVHYVHPDKPAELWINEVGVADAYQRQGLGRLLMEALLEHGRSLGCAEAWVLTQRDNLAARGLYRCAGGREETVVCVTFSLSSDG